MGEDEAITVGIIYLPILRELKAFHDALDRHVGQAVLPTDGIAGIGTPDLQLRQLPPVRVVPGIGLSQQAILVRRVDVSKVVGHVRDDHVVVRLRLQRSRPGIAVSVQ